MQRRAVGRGARGSSGHIPETARGLPALVRAARLARSSGERMSGYLHEGCWTASAAQHSKNSRRYEVGADELVLRCFRLQGRCVQQMSGTCGSCSRAAVLRCDEMERGQRLLAAFHHCLHAWPPLAHLEGGDLSGSAELAVGMRRRPVPFAVRPVLRRAAPATHDPLPPDKK